MDLLACLNLLCERLVKLKHVKIRHQNVIVVRGLLDRLDDEVVHGYDILEKIFSQLLKELKVRKNQNELYQTLHDGNEDVDKVVDFKNPNESDFHSPTEDFIVWNFLILTSVEKFLVDGQFHQIVVEGNKQIDIDVLLQRGLV